MCRRRSIAARGQRATVLTLVLLTMFAAVAGVPAGAADGVLTSIPYGVLDFGDRIAYRVSGSGCEEARVHVRVVAGATSALVAGADSRPLRDGVDPSGCVGTATVPSFQEVRAAGWRQGDPIALDLVSGDQTVPLHYVRLEADLMTAAAGAPAVAAAGDPDTGAWDRAITMTGGDAIHIGRVDVRGMDSISLRLCVPTGAQQSTVDAVLEQRHEAPIYATLRQGSVAGPSLLDPVDLAANVFTDSRLDTHGFGNGCWRLLPLPFTGRAIENAPDLYLVIESPSVGTVVVNSIDFNGTGAKIPGVEQDDPPGMQTIFDGSSFAGWTQSNCALRDGAATNSPDSGIGSGCSFSYDPSVQNMILRFQIRRESFFDNGAIYVPSEIQVRSVGEYLPGGYFGEYAARMEKFNTFPDWSDMEVVQLGRRYVVSLNGHTVTDHLTGAEPAPYRIGLANQPEWSYRYGAHGEFGSESPKPVTPSDWGQVWWRNIRLYRCASATDPACTAAADANLGQAPQA